jgi:hypothetical protein
MSSRCQVPEHIEYLRRESMMRIELTMWKQFDALNPEHTKTHRC